MVAERLEELVLPADKTDIVELIPIFSSKRKAVSYTHLNIPAEMAVIAEIFEKIALMDIDVDIISLSPVQGAQTSLSFTIRDLSLIHILSFKNIKITGNKKTGENFKNGTQLKVSDRKSVV